VPSRELARKFLRKKRPGSCSRGHERAEAHGVRRPFRRG
jgi:hypothetical protein